MHIPGELVIVAFVIILLLAVVVIGIEYSIPLYVRANFDDLCSSYLADIEIDAGLSTAKRMQLIEKLGQIGIINVTITAPYTGTWGEEATLRVEGDYVFRTTRYTDMSKANTLKRIVYVNSTRIISLDAAG